VDDLVIISKDVHRFKNLVSAKYLMEDLGPLRHLLGMKIERVGLAIRVLQSAYTNKILDSYGMKQARTASTPLVPNTRLRPASEKERSNFLRLDINYRRAMGLLNYLSVSTRPDIAFAMSQLSQHLENPGTLHWDACIHLLRYLAGLAERGLTLGASISPVKIYTDANYANDILTSYSYWGYVVMFGDSIISWKAKKEPLVSSSTTEAENTGLYEGGREAVWIRRLLHSLGYPQSAPTPILCDNQAAIQLAKNAVFHDRTKHFKVHLHWIRKKVESVEVSTTYISTHSNLADFLTKSLHKIKHKACTEGINLRG
jgi:hypothetical protein